MSLLIFLKVLAIVLIVVGVGIVAAAKFIVKRRNLADRVELPEGQRQSLSVDEQAKQRFISAVLRVKLQGLAVALPGFILVLVLFK